MALITDEYIKEKHTELKDYTIVLIKPTSKRKEAGADAVILEHARKNFSLREDGVLSIVCPVFGDYNLSGLYIFNVIVEEARKIMDDDPAVNAGIFQYEIYPCKSFSGDSLDKITKRQRNKMSRHLSN